MKNEHQEKRTESKRPKTLLSWMEMVAESYALQNRPGTASNYLRTRRSLVAWLCCNDRKDMPLIKLDAQQVADYQEWLTTERKSRNTQAFHLRNLRAAYNKAKKEGLLPLSHHDCNPFENVSTTTMPTHKRTSASEVIVMLEHLDIAEGLRRLGKKADRRSFAKMVADVTFARDTFVFCFFACGLPFVDFAYLTRNSLHQGLLCYERHKTGTYIEMEVLPRMQRFIDRYATDGYYLFPVLTAKGTKESYCQYSKAIRRYNHRLQLLSQMLSGDISLSTYAPRHTWANTVYHHGMPESCIKERLGHTSLHTTRSYLRSFESSKIDEMNKRILGTIFK